MTDPAADAVDAVRSGDVDELRRVLRGHPGIAAQRLTTHGGRTLLHVATDWPGHLPNVAATIRALVEAGADVDAPGPGPHPETPLHWAASSNDVAAIEALVGAGANIDVPGAVIGGGPPLSDATAFGQWEAAWALVRRGADISAWNAAALGLLDHLQPLPDEDLAPLLWAACHGAQPEVAALLLDAGADINWIGWDDLTPLDVAERAGAAELAHWLRAQGAMTIVELKEKP